MMNKLLITNVVMGGIDMQDYPDFCDAFIQDADYNGTPMTDEDLEEINKDAEYVHQQALESII